MKPSLTFGEPAGQIQALVSRDLFLFPVSKYKNTCGLSVAWHRVKCCMHWVRRIISKPFVRGRIWSCEAPTWQLRRLCAFDSRLQMTFEFHDKYHPISGIEHVIKVWFEVRLSDLYATFWFEWKCSRYKIVDTSEFNYAGWYPSKSTRFTTLMMLGDGGFGKMIISSLMVQYIGRNQQ